MALEAKDIYNTNNLINPNLVGFNPRNTNGELYLTKFVNTLDYSLDLIKMRELYEKTYRRSDFSFNVNKHNYTQTVICVKFSYAYKNYNKCGKNTFIKAGYTYSDLHFEDSVCIKDNQLIGIITNKKIKKPISTELLGEYFIFDDGMYKQVKNFKTLMTKAQLRDYLYTHGFYCDGLKYVRFKRSSGSSRVGKCLFIDENLYKTFHKWDLCGLDINEGDEIDLAAFEAYISLPSSNIIDTIQIESKNFLIIDDYESIFKDEVVGIDYVNGKLVAKQDYFEIKNSIFDGQSILDRSLFPDKYKNKGMLLLRNRFFKSAGFNGNIQKWFKDNNINNVTQLNGFTLATNIEDIKIITTPSSIKYLKFDSLRKWFDHLDTTFGIVKFEKPTHFFDGRMVQCHYQLINTLQLSKNDIKQLLQPNLDYIKLIREDPDVLRYHIKYPYSDSEDVDIVPLHTKNDIIFKLMGINSDFSKTKLYYDFRNDLIKSMIKNLKRGHVLINGNYSTLLGNGIEMLQHSIGKFNGKSIIGKGNVFSKNFKFGKTILGSRSPHINQGNVLLVKNVYNNLIDTYLNLSKEVIYINSIEENILQRLNGADFDSDTMLLTDNTILINAAIKNYNTFKVPTCLVKAKKVKRFYTNQDKTDLDIKTSVNKIGEIVNFSQYLNSIFWNNINKGQTIQNNLDLYYDICKLAVLSGIEIDRAKKEYELSSSKVLKELKKKWYVHKDDSNKLVKPMFFKMVTQENGYELNKNHIYKYFKTPMDYLQKEISSFNFRENRKQKQSFLKFSDIIRKPETNINGCFYEKCTRILNLILVSKQNISKLYIGYDKKNKEDKVIANIQAEKLKQCCIDYINDIALHEKTTYLLLKSIEDKKYKSVCKLILDILFSTSNKIFYSLIINKNNINQLIENPSGAINIFDYNFSKTALIIQKNA